MTTRGLLEEYDASRARTPYKHPALVIEPSFVPGQCDALAVDDPVVFSDAGEFFMAYVCWDGIGYQTALSRSADLLHWSPGELILTRDDSHPVRRYNAALNSIVRDHRLESSGQVDRIDGRVIGSYNAYPDPGYEIGPGVIGFCASTDFTSWHDVGGLLRPEDGSWWESGGLYKSWLLRHEGLYYCFYNAKNQAQGTWREQIGYAVSPDLVTWSRPHPDPVVPHGGPGDFDERFAANPCIVRDGDYWLMFYFGYSFDGHARESFAVSRDLKSWEKSGEIVIDIGPEGSVDSKFAHKPDVITSGGRLYHFYTAVRRTPSRKVGEYQINEHRGIAVAYGDPLG